MGHDRPCPETGPHGHLVPVPVKRLACTFGVWSRRLEPGNSNRDSLHGLRRHVGDSSPFGRQGGRRVSRGSGLHPRKRRAFGGDGSGATCFSLPAGAGARARTSGGPGTHRLHAKRYACAQYRAVGTGGTGRRAGDLPVRSQRRAEARAPPLAVPGGGGANAVGQPGRVSGPGRSRPSPRRGQCAGGQRGLQCARYAAAPEGAGPDRPRGRRGGRRGCGSVGRACRRKCLHTGCGCGGVHGAQGTARAPGHGGAVGARGRRGGPAALRRDRRRLQPQGDAASDARSPGSRDGQFAGNGRHAGRV